MTDETSLTKEEGKGSSAGVSEEFVEEMGKGKQTIPEKDAPSARCSGDQSYLEPATFALTPATQSNETLVDQNDSEQMHNMAIAHGFQEHAGKNASSALLRVVHQTSYPTGCDTIPHPGARVNDTTNNGETVTNCNDTLTNEVTVATDRFVFSLGSSGSHPPPTTDPLQCSDN